jgi:hypothetical protein
MMRNIWGGNPDQIYRRFLLEAKGTQGSHNSVEQSDQIHQLSQSHGPKRTFETFMTTQYELIMVTGPQHDEPDRGMAMQA